jgi:hypothetical protein
MLCLTLRLKNYHYNKDAHSISSILPWYRKKEQSNSSAPKDSRLSRLLIWPECHMKGSTGFPVSVPDIPKWCHPLASFTDKQVATSYSACRPHPWHVVCTGGYSDLRIAIHGPYCSTSYVIWDPTLTTTYPSYEQNIQVIIKIIILGT